MVNPATAVSTYLLCQVGNKNNLIKLPGVESSIVEQILSLAYIANQEAYAMVTRNVVLTESQDQLVQNLVASGRYQNASEALRAGLRLLEQEEAGLVSLKQSLQEGVAQAQTGDLAEGNGSDAIRRAFAKARTKA
jgi:antitoxin ParD1/3/4